MNAEIESELTAAHIERSDLSEIEGCNAGSKCFIIGSGPSLIEQGIPDAVHNKPNVVMTVNASILLVDWSKEDPDRSYGSRVWLSNDSMCLVWDYFWDKVAAWDCDLFVRTSWHKHERVLEEIGQYRYFRPRKTELEHPLLPYEEDGGLTWVTSVPTAIDLAILMGCSPIYLMGIDHQMKEGKSHFWQFWPSSLHPKLHRSGKLYTPEQSHQKRFFQQNIPVFGRLREFAASRGQEIFNCNPESKVSEFPMIPLEEAIAT
jgi:hypothetical protein